MSYESWGTFHIISFIFPFFFVALMYLIFKKRTLKCKQIVLLVINLIGLAFLIYDMFEVPERILYRLPFHMCSLNLFIQLYTLIKKDKTMSNMLILWSLGAIGALVFNLTETHLYTYDFSLWLYYIPHLVGAVIPVLTVLLKVTEFDYKTIPTTLLYTLIAYTIAHIANEIINNYYIQNNINKSWSNFMFSYYPETNPVLNFLWDLCPYRYFYMLTLTPALILVLLLFYSGQISKAIKTKKQKKHS